VADLVAVVKSSASGPIFVLAVLGCFALAFGVAYVFEVAMIWLLEIRLRMPYIDVAKFAITTWRAIASLLLAVLLCIWISRR
jgi:hypothetical protein